MHPESDSLCTIPLVERDWEFALSGYEVSLTQIEENPYNWGFHNALGGSMYAVIRSGGKQYRVEPGATIEVERLEGKVGGKVTFDDVLSVRTDEKKVLAGPATAKAKVVGKIVAQTRGPKLKVLKFKKTRQYKIQRGHRQNLTAVEVSDIQLA
jgi:large subunit ribosomal protein L21